MGDAGNLSPGELLVVATPIGNPEDLSPRARQSLADADVILAEDTRRTSRLCAQAGITPRRLLSFFEHNESDRETEVLGMLRRGHRIALVSDAGTPLLADPGYGLVRTCRREGIPVIPIPGPSAPACALSVAGIPPLPHSFLGFLPRQSSARRNLLESFAHVPGSLVFFERKDRLRESLAIAHAVLGDREAAICRELTKTHEELILSSLGEIASHADGMLGEITVVVGPPKDGGRTPAPDVRRRLAAAQAQGVGPKEAVRLAHASAIGWSAREIYALLLDAPHDAQG
jgi:16S rRNA (cytidine1402-2'-O)-methyltransferase